MKTYNTKKIWVAISVLVLVALSCKMGSDESVVPSSPSVNEPSSPPSTGGGIDRGHLMLATVQVMMEKRQGSDFAPFGSGSGTIISADGMILTNAHVGSPAAMGDTAGEPDRLTIAVTQTEDQPPVLSYIAEVRAVDGSLDLAVLQIVSTLNGSAVNPADLNLPYVPLGNSDNIHIGDHLNIFGFPGVGKETITYTEGSVAGFTSETPPGERAWIKTAVNVAHGNSGGLAADDRGEIIGIPTQVEGDCNQADTNGDGQIDTCIPNGNAINYLRPINFALPLIKAAQADQSYQSQYSQFGEVTPGSGQEAFGPITWVQVDDQGKFGDEIPVTSYPSGSAYLVGLFEFSGMTDGQTWTEVWTINGKETYRGSVAWDKGAQGKYYTFMANKGDPLPDGAYHVELFAGTDTLLTTGDVTVGDGTGNNTPPPTADDTVTLYGTVTDKDTGNSLSGVYVFVLVPNVTYDQWRDSGWSDADVQTSLQTDSNGGYRVTGIPRNSVFTIVFSVEGYYDASGDNLQFSSEDPSPYEMNVELSQ